MADFLNQNEIDMLLDMANEFENEDIDDTLKRIKESEVMGNFENTYVKMSTELVQDTINVIERLQNEARHSTRVRPKTLKTLKEPFDPDVDCPTGGVILD